MAASATHHHPRAPMRIGTVRIGAVRIGAIALVLGSLLLTGAACADRSPRAQPPAPEENPVSTATPTPPAVLPPSVPVAAGPSVPAFGSTAGAGPVVPGGAPVTGAGTVPPPPGPGSGSGYPTDAKVYAQDVVLAWQHGEATRLAQLATASVISALRARTDAADPTWVYQGQDGAAGSTYVTFTNAHGGTLLLKVVNQYLGSPHAVVEARS